MEDSLSDSFFPNGSALLFDLAFKRSFTGQKSGHKEMTGVAFSPVEGPLYSISFPHKALLLNVQYKHTNLGKQAEVNMKPIMW